MLPVRADGRRQLLAGRLGLGKLVVLDAMTAPLSSPIYTIYGRPSIAKPWFRSTVGVKIAAIYMASSPVAKRFLPPTRLSTAYIHSAFGWRFDARPRWNLLDSTFNISTAFVWPDSCPGYAADGSTDLAIV